MRSLGRADARAPRVRVTPPQCQICHDQGQHRVAEYLMPQSTDQGKTVAYILVCPSHAEGWLDGSDWVADPAGFHLKRIFNFR